MLLAHLQQVVTAAIQKFVAELRAGGPYAKGGSLAAAVPTDGNKPGSAAAQNSAQQKTQSPAESSQPARIAAPAQTSKVCLLHPHNHQMTITDTNLML